MVTYQQAFSPNGLATKPRQSALGVENSISRNGKGCNEGLSTRTWAGEAENDSGRRCASLRLRHMYVSSRSSLEKAGDRLL